MIDTHAHLYSEQFYDDADKVIADAVRVGITKFVVPSVDSKSYVDMTSLCKKYRGLCFPCIGLHPVSIDENHEKELAFVEEKAKTEKFYAIGETGIDCYWSLKYLDRQRQAFEYQVRLALKLDLPIIIHARNSFDEIYKILDRKAGGVRGVFHGFSGTIDDYEKIKTYGTFKIGIGGPITFKNSILPDIVRRMRLEDIVLETDAPYLAPHPRRGKRNEPAYMRSVAEKTAEIKNVDFSEVDRITTENAEKMFGI